MILFLSHAYRTNRNMLTLPRTYTHAGLAFYRVSYTLESYLTYTSTEYRSGLIHVYATHTRTKRR
jgi:hypothetical protein